MSQQVPQQIPQQMPVVYPVTGTVPTSSSSSNGSYGAVFIVLAVIVTISAFACFLGRLCNKGQNVAKPSRQSLPTKEKDTKGNANGFQTKDGDIEFGYDKRFASAKAGNKNEPNIGRPDSFGKPNMVQSSSFHEPTGTGRPKPNSMHEPSIGQSGSFHKQNKVQPSWSPEPAMERPNSFQEPTMGQSYSLHKDEPQGDQVRFGADRDNQINFKIRTRAQRY